MKGEGNEMPISGLVVQVRPEQRASVSEQLAAMDGIEVVATPESAPIVVVVEAQSVRDEETLYKSIRDLPGVISVGLSYHNFEDLVEG